MDIRDHMPSPPCIQCGAGMCEKAKNSNGYVCKKCGHVYSLMIFEGPNAEVLTKVAPMLAHFRLTTSHWMNAMEEAFSELKYNDAMTAMLAYKEWLDEIATPMIERVRQIANGEDTEPIPPGELKIPGGWGDGKE